MEHRVVGVGMTRFTQQPDRSAPSLVLEAVQRTLEDAGAAWDDVDAVFVGSARIHEGVGQRTLMSTPLLGKPIVNVENACASGGTALREALAWLGSGFAGTALVVGVETLTRSSTGVLAPPEEDISGYLGSTFATAYALKARRHMEIHDLTVEELAAVTVKSRAHGRHNPDAHFRTETTVEEVLAGPLIADPLTRAQCCPNVDGAAAALVVAPDQVHRFERAQGRAGVQLAASAMVSGRRRDHVDAPWDATRRAAGAAYEAAGLGPEDLDVVEVHDAFTIGEILHYEDLGLCPPGDGGKYAVTGQASVGGGGTPVNPSGGLLSRGHPLGASGLAQIVELTRQLRGEAGPRQVDGARVALAHIMGGNVSELDSNACTVHILRAA